MKKLSEYLFLWAVGGCLYYTFEIVFRGFSQWTMFVLGGLCLVFCTAQGRAGRWRDPLGIQILRCMIFVTPANLLQESLSTNGWNLGIWDYSNVPFQLFGQICLPFMALFGLLCTIGIYMGGYLLHVLYGEEKPKIPIW